MALTNSQYDHIMKTYEEKQYKAHYELERRQAYVAQKIPEYKDISEKISSLSIQHAREILSGDDAALDRLKEELKKLRSKKAHLLRQAGIPKDYLLPPYECKICNDTGYVTDTYRWQPGYEAGVNDSSYHEDKALEEDKAFMVNEKCHCFRRQIIDFLYEQSNIRGFLQENNFSRLSMEYYTGDDLLRFKYAVERCRKFIDTFKIDYHNLFFYGTVGTGKSFLSGCIAKELIDLGNSVIYFSATSLFDRVSQASFNYDNKNMLADLFGDLYDCDLLIIDDLGTELTNSFSSSHFFSCLNERFRRKKPIIISTNLSLEELRDRYSDRIFSRITSNFDLCKITGIDIRMYKKRVNNRK